MMIDLQSHTSASSAKTGFGFEAIMRNPDYTRFTAWYARFSLLAPSSSAAFGAEPVQAPELSAAA